MVPFARSRLSLDTSAEPVLPFARPRLHFPVRYLGMCLI